MKLLKHLLMDLNDAVVYPGGHNMNEETKLRVTLCKQSKHVSEQGAIIANLKTTVKRLRKILRRSTIQYVYVGGSEPDYRVDLCKVYGTGIGCLPGCVADEMVPNSVMEDSECMSCHNIRIQIALDDTENLA